ncbi:MAG TPA: glycosyltransferase family 2 protein [Candidatus Eisenbacteria bacterium]
MSDAFPTITVITVCRNALPLLPSTVESVLAQEYPALTYWIVDGASTDGTPSYLSSLARLGVRSLSEPDRGIADAMNKGVRLSSGEWIAHLHAGDSYLPGTLAAVAEAARAGDADVLCGGVWKEEERGRTLYHPEPRRLPLDMTIHHAATWTRRGIFERLGGFDSRYPNAMDYEFFLRARATGARFAVIPRPLASMAKGGQSERSLWVTMSETHAIRRRVLARGLGRSPAYLAWVLLRGWARRGLQRAGLGGFVAWFRRRFALARKG